MFVKTAAMRIHSGVFESPAARIIPDAMLYTNIGTMLMKYISR